MDNQIMNNRERGYLAGMVIIFIASILALVAAGCTPARAAPAPPSLRAVTTLFVYDSVRVTTPYTLPVQPDGFALDSAILIVPCFENCENGVNQRRKRLPISPGTRVDVTNVPQSGIGECFAGNIVLTIFRKGSTRFATTPLQFCRGVPPLGVGPSVGPATADSIP